MEGIRGLKKIAHVDPALAIATFALLSIGMVMVYSASSAVAVDRFGDGAYYLKRFLVHIAIGLSLSSVLFFMNIRALRKLALPALVVMGAMLLVTLAVGVSAKHATRWLGFAGVTFQPSELAKPVLVLYVASYLSKRGEEVKDFLSGLLPLLLTCGALLVLILRQPDFGTTVVLAATIGIMLFVGRAKLSHLGALATVAGLGAFALIQGAAYRRQRLLTFLDPWKDPLGSGFQVIQSFIAFNRGGFQGQGLGDGAQKLHYLPEAHTDFIYSIIAEELGFFGSIAVIALFAVIIVQGFRLALRIREPFASQLALGATSVIGIQACLNMAVAMGLVPTKGLTLPLVSYGGTSLIATLLMIAVLLSLSSSVSLTGHMARKRT